MHRLRASFQEVASPARQNRNWRRPPIIGRARAAQSAARPRRSSPCSRAAARSPESFYGLIARETLGHGDQPAGDPAAADPSDCRPAQCPSCRGDWRAIGERALAEEALRHQARIGRPADHHALIAMAQQARASRCAILAREQRSAGAPARTARRAIPARAGPRGMAGGSIRRSLMATSSRNRNFRAQGGEPGRRGRADAGAARSLPSKRRRAAALPYSRASLTDPTIQSRIRPELHRADAQHAGRRRAAAAGDCLLQRRPAAGARWAAINDKGDPLLWIEIDPLLGDALLRPAGDAEHVGLSGLSGDRSRQA